MDAMGPALEMGSLREAMVKEPCVWVVVACEREGSGEGEEGGCILDIVVILGGDAVVKISTSV
jgi:hypothetical protein